MNRAPVSPGTCLWLGGLALLLAALGGCALEVGDENTVNWNGNPYDDEPSVVSTSAALTYNNCSSERREVLARAMKDLRATIQDMRAQIRSGGAYELWMGDYDSTFYFNGQGGFYNHNWVDQVLAAIESKWGKWTFSCGSGDHCKGDYNALVNVWDIPFYDHKEDWVYFCPDYWKLPYASINAGSQVGVLLHELTHRVTAGRVTDIKNGSICEFSNPKFPDTCYGAKNARNLAKQEPFQASFNAENYEHFGNAVMMAPRITAAAM